MASILRYRTAKEELAIPLADQLRSHHQVNRRFFFPLLQLHRSDQPPGMGYCRYCLVVAPHGKSITVEDDRGELIIPVANRQGSHQQMNRRVFRYCSCAAFINYGLLPLLVCGCAAPHGKSNTVEDDKGELIIPVADRQGSHHQTNRRVFRCYDCAVCMRSRRIDQLVPFPWIRRVPLFCRMC